MKIYFRFQLARPHPPPHKISNNILVYLTSYRILQLVPPPPLPVIKIVKYCGVWGGGGAKILQKVIAPPLSLSSSQLSIVASGEEGGAALVGAKILQKIMAPPLSVIKIVTYCCVWGGGGHWGRQNPKKDYHGAPFLCHQAS